MSGRRQEIEARKTWIEDRVMRLAQSLCTSLWHDEGHSSHSACSSCGAKWMRRERIKEERAYLDHFADRAEKYARDIGMTATAELAEVNRKLAETREALKRAAYVAEHLMQMIDRETWRAHGADVEGVYEGDHHEAQLALEVKEWAALAVADEATS